LSALALAAIEIMGAPVSIISAAALMAMFFFLNREDLRGSWVGL
jgi:hypothetical protein